MNPGDPRPLLDRHAARVLTRWRERLRALPPSSALAHPDLLAPLMAPALARVRQETTRPLDNPSGGEPVACRCGLNPLVAFYLTGECATFDVLWGQADALPHLAPGEREYLCRSLSQAWRRVATDEISLFCGVCQRRMSPTPDSGEKDETGRRARSHNHSHDHDHGCHGLSEQNRSSKDDAL